MSEVDRILIHYDQVMAGDPWHGDPIARILDGMTAEAAAARPLPGAHSIWEILSHMTFWEGVVTKRLQGQRAGLVEELNFPAMPAATDENWRKALDKFRASNQRFREELGKFVPTKLDELSAAGKRTYYEEAQGIIEHHLYHLGQIAMLRKTQG